MSSTSKQRISARGWLARAARALADLVHETADKVALVEAIADFDKRMDTLDNIHELIEVELDGDELLADIEKAADFRDVCRKQRTAAKRLLLPTFSGDVTKWPSFWDQFTAVIVRTYRK